MVKGQRELVIGLTRDAQFGPCVMFGLGGIFTEILKDISFRVAPLERRDALEMMHDIKGHRILEAVRGMEAADLDALADILIKVGQIGLENEKVKEIDINEPVAECLKSCQIMGLRFPPLISREKHSVLPPVIRRASPPVTQKRPQSHA
jgi:acetyl-CoA synthetase (ADP-forming)